MTKLEIIEKINEFIPKVIEKNKEYNSLTNKNCRHSIECYLWGVKKCPHYTDNPEYYLLSNESLCVSQEELANTLFIIRQEYNMLCEMINQETEYNKWLQTEGAVNTLSNNQTEIAKVDNAIAKNTNELKRTFKKLMTKIGVTGWNISFKCEYEWEPEITFSKKVGNGYKEVSFVLYLTHDTCEIRKISNDADDLFTNRVRSTDKNQMSKYELWIINKLKTISTIMENLWLVNEPLEEFGVEWRKQRAELYAKRIELETMHQNPHEWFVINIYNKNN